MGLLRKVIRIRATDSPNVRWVEEQLARGVPLAEVDKSEIVPGVLTWDQYQADLKTLDPVAKSVKLLAEWWEGAEMLLFPTDWLDRGVTIWNGLVGRGRQAKGIGIDSASGGDNTSWAAVDELGVIEIVSKKTVDTSEVTGHTVAFGAKHGCPSTRWVFDAGGGGQQHADYLNRHNLGPSQRCKIVAFGASASLEPKYGKQLLSKRREVREEKVAYRNRRAQMYLSLSSRCDPNHPEFTRGFAIPPYDYPEGPYDRLRRALAVLPKLTDKDGIYWLPSKGSMTQEMLDRGQPTLSQMIGFSPDEADAVVLALHGMEAKVETRMVGAAW